MRYLIEKQIDSLSNDDSLREDQNFLVENIELAKRFLNETGLQNVPKGLWIDAWMTNDLKLAWLKFKANRDSQTSSQDEIRVGEHFRSFLLSKGVKHAWEFDPSGTEERNFPEAFDGLLESYDGDEHSKRYFVVDVDDLFSKTDILLF